MGHLNPDALIDLADGTTPESAEPHLATCAACRNAVTDLRATMAIAASVEVPEPAPGFWRELSVRVHDAATSNRSSGRAWRVGWSWPRLVMPLAAAAAAVAIVAVVATRIDRSPAASLPSAVATAAPIGPLGAADDPSLGVVAGLASTLDLDAARELPLATHAGATDEAVDTLTTGELQQLHRLLSEELGQL